MIGFLTCDNTCSLMFGVSKNTKRSAEIRKHSGHHGLHLWKVATSHSKKKVVNKGSTFKLDLKIMVNPPIWTTHIY